MTYSCYIDVSAYEILSDEEQRKNYDMHGVDQGNSRFEDGGPGYGTSHFNFVFFTYLKAIHFGFFTYLQAIHFAFICSAD